MQVIYTEMGEGVREMQSVISAFMSDLYPNGDFVATLDDILALQKATVAFLADRGDGERFCLDNTEPGLLLPGEQFFLEVHTAVPHVCCKQNHGEDVIDLVDKCLLGKMSTEDELDDSSQHVSKEISNLSQSAYTSFAYDFGTDPPPPTPQPNNQTAADTGSEHLFNYLEGILSPSDDVDLILELCDVTEEDGSDNVGSISPTEIHELSFDAPTALCHAQASYAASFFDPLTATTISYASLDSLLEMDEQFGNLPIMVPQMEDEANLTVVTEDNSPRWDTYFDSDSEEDVCSSGVQVASRPIQVATHLPIIPEENESSSAVPSSSLDFSNHRGLLQPLSLRQPSFLDDEHDESGQLSKTLTFASALGPVTEIYYSSTLPCNREGLHGPESEESTGWLDLFKHDIWETEPFLELSLPAPGACSIISWTGADLDLFKVVTAVLRIVQARSWTELSTFGADIKHEMHRLVEPSHHTASPERLDNIIDLAMHCMATAA